MHAMQMRARIAQAVQQRLRHRHLRLQAFHVLRCLVPREQHRHLCRPLRDGTEPQIDTDTGCMPQRHGDHVRGHALGHAQLGRAPQFMHELLPALLAVQQQAGLAAASLGISGQQGTDARAHVLRGRVGIAHGARGADRGAGAAAHAQVWIDHHLLAHGVAADGLGRADVHAGIAAHPTVAAVGAELLAVAEKLGLLEFTHQVAQAQQRLQVLPVPAEVPLRQRVLQKGGPGAGRTQVQHQIKVLRLHLGLALEADGTRHHADLHAIAVAGTGRHVNLVIEPDGVLGAGGHAGIAARAQVQVDGVVRRPLQRKSPQPTLE